MPPLFNTRQTYGLIAILLHWLIAVGLIALFASGLWMTGLDYYHPWYNRAPALHISFGVVVALLVLLRLLLSLVSQAPEPIAGRLFAVAAYLTHMVLHLLPLVIAAAGYLIVTAEGKGVAVFSMFELPPLLESAGERADSAGTVHLWSSWTLMILSLAHAAAAVFHHAVLHDVVLLRMFGYDKTKRGERA
ncbi:MAG: cytochrome b/b6 domain-containing protein [Pseudomonadota bacterium]